jgi:microcystin-dependent protein
VDYSLSPDYYTHTGTGQRMHRENQAVPTALSDKDINAITWSLMEIVKDAGLAGIQFDPDVPSTYRVLLNAIKAIYAASTSDLPGRVAIFWQPTPPPGWIWMEGDLLSRAAYPRLWAHVQTVGAVSEADWLAGAFGRFSSGDGNTTFRMPDIRGQFFRAADRSRGVDIGRLLFTAQQWLNGAHGHGVTDPTHAHANYDPSHSHGVSDPTHGHALTDNGHAHNTRYGEETPAGLDRSNASGTEIANWGDNRNFATSTSGTGISVNGAATGVSINGATSNLVITSGATGISIQSNGGVESRPLNLAVPFYMKY